VKKPKFTLVTVIAVAEVMLVAATAEMAITGYAFAYNRNQATSAAATNDCGNGQVPTNIGCQNTDSQIQGDENSVALTSQQTFPGASPCVACFDSLTSEQRTDFEEALDELTGGGIEQLCEAFAEHGEQDRGRIVSLLISVLGFETALEIILCLEEVFGLSLNPAP
jgi:hypothetical protein